MNTYSNADLFGRKLFNNGYGKRTLTGAINTLISSFSKTISLRLEIPTNSFIRTQLLCEYIEDQVKVPFGIHNFLMVIYLDFISNSIKKYDPMSVYRSITYSSNDTIKLVFGDEEFEYNRQDGTRTELLITMDKRDALKGEMLLAEIDELYGFNISLERMLTSLWIEFVDTYKKGDNNKALNNIIAMLKKQKKEEV